MRKSALRLQSTYVLLLTGGLLSACAAACGGSTGSGGNEGTDTGTDAAEGEGGATGDDGAQSTPDGGGEDVGTTDSTMPESGSETDAPPDSAADSADHTDASGDSSTVSEAGGDSSEAADAANDSAEAHDSGTEGGGDSGTLSEAGSDAGLAGDASQDSSVSTESDAGPEAAVDAGVGTDAGSGSDASIDASTDALAEAAVDAAPDANPCGDGVVDNGEQCDLGSQNSDLFSSCSTTCTTTSLLLHLDASNPAGNGTTPDDGTAMSAWVDLATGLSVVQATTAYQPVFRSSAINGKPAFQFDGVSTFFDANLNINASVLPQVTIVVVLDNIAGDTQPYSGVWGADLGGWGRFMSAVGTGGSGVSNGGGFTFISGLNDDATRIVSTTLLDGATVNGSAAYINGTLSTSFTGSTNANDTRLSIGSLNGPNHFGSGYQEYGYIAEVLVYGAVLSDTDRQTVESALMTKY